MTNYITKLIDRAVQCFKKGDLPGAEKLLKRALKAHPNNAGALHMLGAILAIRKDWNGAIRNFKKVIAIEPNHSHAQLSLAKAISIAMNDLDAIPYYQKATTLAPGNSEAWFSYGSALNNLNRYNDALACYDKALHINPKNSTVWANRAITLTAMQHFDQALASHKNAIELGNSNALIWDNYATTFKLMARYDEALSAYKKALEIDPHITYTYGNWLHTKMMLCDWSDLDQAFEHLADQIEGSKNITLPFIALSTPISAQIQLKCAELFVNDTARDQPNRVLFSRESNSDRITLGYFSADFHNHATTSLMAELFEKHDKSRFKLIALSFGPDRQDEMRQRVAAAFDLFVDVGSKTDIEVAALSRSLHVDIAIDLKGFTEENRVGIFAHHAAPIQVSYLGFPGTMGAPYIDYLIADHTLIDDSTKDSFAEKIIYLPHSYQVNDRSRKISDRRHTRAEHGLPESGFIFCCFNNSYKIVPEVFDIWMRLLLKVPGSVLWLLAGNDTAVMHLKMEAEKRGVAGVRLIFAARTELPEHLARQRLADLFLDTFYYNAHTSASDALWTGLPVLTLSGETFASRVCASLLTAIGLPEMITTTREEYESLAYELAQPDELSNIRSKLADNLSTFPLFNTSLFTKHIESAYSQIFERHLLKLPPDDIKIQS